jgi:hypothetical protein
VESNVVPKLLVVFYGDDNDVTAAANAAATGARTVRFMEVDSQAGTPDDDAAEYDGIVIAAPAGTTHPGLVALLDGLASGGRAANTVFGVAGENAGLLEQVSRVGGIIVTVPRSADRLADARALGARAAKVAGWVRHGLGHEAENHHHHHHH